MQQDKLNKRSCFQLTENDVENQRALLVCRAGLRYLLKAIQEESMSIATKKGTIVFIPTPLRQFTNQNSVLRIDGKTVGELLRNLAADNPALQRHIFSDDGKIRGFVNVYLNNEDIRFLQKENTPVNDTDTLSIIPSIAGG